MLLHTNKYRFFIDFAVFLHHQMLSSHSFVSIFFHLHSYYILFFSHLQLHTFPEGKICQDNAPIGRLKWGVASLIAKARVPPIVLPICHSGFEKVSIFVPVSIISMSIYTLSSLIIVQYLFAFIDISH